MNKKRFLEERNSVKEMRITREQAQQRNGLTEDNNEGLIPGLPDHLATRCLARVHSLSSLWGVSRAWQELLCKSKNLFFHRERTEIGHSNINWLYVLIASSKLAFSWHAFDPIAAEWHELPQMPHGTSFELSRPGFLGPYSHSIQCASTDQKLFVVAGTKLSSVLVLVDPNRQAHVFSESSRPRIEPALERPLVFDVYTRVWTQGPRYITPRRWCCCGIVRSKLLVASGCGSEWDISTATSAEVWDTATVPAVWRAVPRLASTKLSREATSAVESSGRLHVVTARVGAVFDAESETWSDMPHGMTRCWNGTGIAYCGKFYVVEDTAGRIKRYEESSERWNTVVEDKRIKNLANIVACNGKICGSVDGIIRVVDITTKPARFREIKLPVPGEVVAMQILNGMLMS